MESQDSQNKVQTNVWQRFTGGFNQAAPLIQWVLSIALIVGGYWLYTRDTQTVQAQSIKELQDGQKQMNKIIDDRKNERDKQLQNIEQKMLTRELYDAYHKADTEKMERIEKLLERLLEKEK